MRIDEFDFELPPEQIAKHPPAERGDSRLLVLDRGAGTVLDQRFAELPSLLRAGDLLVRNDTRVLPARLRGTRAGGGAVEVLLLEHVGTGEDELWTCLARPGKRLRGGSRVTLAGEIDAEWQSDAAEDGIYQVRLHAHRPIAEILEEAGEMPLPPYLDRPVEGSDRRAYQTTYASASGAVAAPTAGLHFTPAIDDRLRAAGVEIVHLTLHVGIATFLPVRVADLDEHRLPAERVSIPSATAAAVDRAKREGRRVVAVGTTTTRALEGRAGDGGVIAGDDRVTTFIRPGFRFRIVDALLTNFHLPRSTLLALVSAFAGRKHVLDAYRHAVASGYRFFSYGDAMLIV